MLHFLAAQRAGRCCREAERPERPRSSRGCCLQCVRLLQVLVERLLLLESSGGCKRGTAVIEKQCKRALLRAQARHASFLIGQCFLVCYVPLARNRHDNASNSHAAGQENYVVAQVLASRRGRATFPSHYKAPIGPEATAHTCTLAQCTHIQAAQSETMRAALDHCCEQPAHEQWVPLFKIQVFFQLRLV